MTTIDLADGVAVECGDYVVVSAEAGRGCNWGVVVEITDGTAKIKWIGSADDRDNHFEFGADADDFARPSVTVFGADARDAAHAEFLAMVQS